MGATGTTAPIRELRSVGDATGSLARAVARGGSDVAARDRLVRRAEQAVGTLGPVAAGANSDDELIAAAVSQISIGTALLTAETALQGSEGAEPVRQAAEMLEGTALALEADTAEPERPRRFETAPDGEPLDVGAAARAALDEMAEAAGGVATALLHRATTPLVDKVPAEWRETMEGVLPAVGGRLAEWGLRAVRAGLTAISRMVDLAGVEALREEIDDLLLRLGQGRDATVLLGAAIGVDLVRNAVERTAARRDDALVERLAGLAAQYDRLCRLLRRAAAVIVTVGAALLATLGGMSPPVAVFTASALVVVLAAAVLLGRDHTGATDLPGRTRGVGLLVIGAGDGGRPRDVGD